MMWNLLLCPDLLPPCLLLLQLLQLLFLFCSLFPPLIDRFLEMRRYDGVAFTNHLQLLIKLSFLGFIPARKNLFAPDGPIKYISSVKRISIKKQVEEDLLRHSRLCSSGPGKYFSHPTFFTNATYSTFSPLSSSSPSSSYSSSPSPSSSPASSSSSSPSS